MKDIKLDINGDIETTEQGEVKTVEGVDALRQWAKQVCSMQVGEWFCDITLGLPWFQFSAQKPFNETMFKSAVANLLRRKDLKIKAFSVEVKADREATFSLEIKQ